MFEKNECQNEAVKLKKRKNFKKNLKKFQFSRPFLTENETICFCFYLLVIFGAANGVIYTSNRCRSEGFLCLVKYNGKLRVEQGNLGANMGRKWPGKVENLSKGARNGVKIGCGRKGPSTYGPDVIISYSNS